MKWICGLHVLWYCFLYSPERYLKPCGAACPPPPPSAKELLNLVLHTFWNRILFVQIFHAYAISKFSQPITTDENNANHFNSMAPRLADFFFYLALRPFKCLALIQAFLFDQIQYCTLDYWVYKSILPFQFDSKGYQIFVSMYDTYSLRKHLYCKKNLNEGN